MSLRGILSSTIAGMLTGERQLQRARRKAERARLMHGEPHVVEAFIDPADPYSWLLVAALLRFRDRYAVSIDMLLVGQPADAVAPDRGRLARWSLRDAALLARQSVLVDLPDGGLHQPDAAKVEQAAGMIAAALPEADALDRCAAIISTLWRGEALPALPNGDAAHARAAGDTRRTAAGHYLGSVLAYGGECYWGIDRLHYLEERLAELGLRHDGAVAALFPPPPDMAGSTGARSPAPEVHFYLSFRSPYTWLAARRIRQVAQAHGAELKLRFVLPMVMRSLPVPREKRRYITLDAAREARRLGVPFGQIVDPVGRPVERGYSLLPWARAQGRGADYVEAFLAGVWSQGIDAGTDAGMRSIVTNAGLDWDEARRIIDNDDWCAEAEENRQELLDLDLWGVPSFRVGDFAVWGQDRIWAVDAALRDVTNSDVHRAHR